MINSSCEPGPCFSHRELTISTTGAHEFHDITDDIAAFVSDCGLVTGVVVIVTMHTTAGLVMNERETGFKRDFAATADRIVPRDEQYRHDDLSVRYENLCPEDAEHPNGHAHLQHTIFGSPSIVLAVEGSEVVLGTWQRVFLLEFDRPRVRRVRMQAVGVQHVTRLSKGKNGFTHAGVRDAVQAVLQ